MHWNKNNRHNRNNDDDKHKNKKIATINIAASGNEGRKAVVMHRNEGESDSVSSWKLGMLGIISVMASGPPKTSMKMDNMQFAVVAN